MRPSSLALAGLVVAASGAACASSTGSACRTSSECGSGGICIDGICTREIDPADGGARDAPAVPGVDAGMGAVDAPAPGTDAGCGDTPCGVIACAPGQGDCDGVASNGCEQDFAWSATACGGCGVLCPEGTSCFAGGCAAACGRPAPTFSRAGCLDLSPRSAASASSTWSESPGPAAAIDGNPCTGWNCGGYAPAWLVLDLGAPTTVHGVALVASMLPGGDVIHVVETSDDGASFAARLTIAQRMDDGLLYTFDLSPPIATRFVRIRTDASPSWVAWYDVAVYSCP